MIGFIFGENEFPKYILRKVKKKKKFIIIDLTSKKNFKNIKNSFSVSIGQFGKIISILKKNKCNKVLFAGSVKKPNFSKIRLDFKGIYYIPEIIKSAKLGDAAILKEIIKIFRKEKIKTISSNSFTPELSLSKGNYTKYKPDKRDELDIYNAVKALNKTGSYNYCQGAVSLDNKIIILESKKGTQSMLKKIKKKNKLRRGVLVKFPKKKQDLRIDLPTIGLQTLRQCRIAGLKGLVLRHKKNIFLDKKKCLEFANKNKMFILVK